MVRQEKEIKIEDKLRKQVGGKKKDHIKEVKYKGKIHQEQNTQKRRKLYTKGRNEKSQTDQMKI